MVGVRRVWETSAIRQFPFFSSDLVYGIHNSTRPLLIPPYLSALNLSYPIIPISASPTASFVHVRYVFVSCPLHAYQCCCENVDDNRVRIQAHSVVQYVVSKINPSFES